ncbi:MULTISPECIES: YbaN family protein [Eubacteriales]|nr:MULTISPECIES: YbaN family protein [Eubacteriales]OUP23321.1 DUF454 domain-containing protein [Gemmiger sp. An194]
MRKWLYISVGIIGLGLGAVGAVMPMLPAFPFLMLAAYCFGKSSERLDQWFRNTKLYKDNLEDYVSGRGMTRKAKIRVVITVTVLMSIGFLIMFGKGIFIGCAVLSAVWIFHVLYFFFGVKTMPEEAE